MKIVKLSAKSYRRIISFIGVLGLLCSACTIKETEEEEIIQSHIQSETEVEVTPVLDFSSYTYQYEDKRNLSWEQDIVYITKMSLLKI